MAVVAAALTSRWASYAARTAIAGADLVTGERLYQPSYRRWLR
ncbi:hypothetical protein [Streptomyces sp. NPDC048560]